MRNYIVNDFAKWKSINEAESPGRTKQTAGMGQRVVGIPIDPTSFKIKIVRDLDVLDPNGKLTPTGFNSIISWIKQQPKWLPYYPALGDLAKNILVYSVSKDTERKQVIVFAIQPKPQGVPAEVQFVHKDEVATLGAGKASVLDAAIKKAETKPEPKETVVTGSVKVPTPLTFDQLKMLTQGQPLFGAIDSAYLNMVKMPEFANLPIMPKLKAELKAGKLGDSAVSLVKGIIAGFNLLDKYGDPVENVNQQVADKLSLFSGKVTAQNASRSYFLGLGAKSIFEQTVLDKETDASNPSGTGNPGGSPNPGGASTGSLPAGFSLDAFVAALSGSGTESLGDIKLPEGGFKKGSVAKGDAEFKKFQQLVINKFAKKLANNELYKKFAKFGADGDYGPTTEKMVAALKGALGASEKDGKVVTAELITKINTNKIDEAMYLGLNSRLVEQFDMGAFEETAKTYKPSKPSGKGKDEAAPKKEEVKGDAKKASELLKGASEAIKNYYSDSSNFEEFKGWNDDEDAAVAEIFGDSYDDKSSWWYRNVRLKYTMKAYELIKALKDDDLNKIQLEKELKKVTGLYGILKKKTYGGSASDEHVWSHVDLDGNKTTFKVDTDF